MAQPDCPQRPTENREENYQTRAATPLTLTEMSADLKLAPKRWVFFSTRESVENNIPSLAALIETFLAVAAYWAASIYFETYLLMIASVIVAPLVLLRSDASVILGIRWFTNWEKNLDQLERNPRSKLASYNVLTPWTIIMVAVGVAASLSYVLTTQFGFSGTWWIRVLSGFAIGWVSLWLAGAAATAMGIALIASVSGSALAFYVSLAATIACVITGEILVMVGVVCAAASIHGVRVVLFRTSFPSVFGFAPGVFLVSLVVRLLASCMHPWLGLRALPRNFRRLVVCTSPRQIPELIPGLKTGETRFDIEWTLARIRSVFEIDGHRNLSRIIMIDVPRIVVWFLPGWIYRVTLKSTVWYWWCIAFMGRDLRYAKDPDLLHWSIMGSLWAKTSIAMSIVSVVSFTFLNFVLSGVLIKNNPLLTIMGYFLLVDWGTFRSWQVMTVIIAALTITMVYLTNDACWQWHHGSARSDQTRIVLAERRFVWIEFIGRVRFLLFFVYLLLVGGQMMLYFNSVSCLAPIPQNVERWAEWIYAERLSQPRCSAASE